VVAPTRKTEDSDLDQELSRQVIIGLSALADRLDAGARIG